MWENGAIASRVLNVSIYKSCMVNYRLELVQVTFRYKVTN